MKKISIISSVENGNLKRNGKLINDAIKTFEGKTIKVTIERQRRYRTSPQNNFYWGVVIPILQEGIKEATGEVRDANSIHYQIILPLLAPDREIINTESGEVILEKITSSEMTTTEFCFFISDIQKWGAEFLGVDIPSPNEEITLQFKE